MLRQILDSVVCVRFENGMLVFSLRMLVCMCVCEQCELEVVSCKREEEKKAAEVGQVFIGQCSLVRATSGTVRKTLILVTHRSKQFIFFNSGSILSNFWQVPRIESP